MKLKTPEEFRKDLDKLIRTEYHTNEGMQLTLELLLALYAHEEGCCDRCNKNKWEKTIRKSNRLSGIK